MIRAFALTAVLVCFTALAQKPKVPNTVPPEHNPENKLTEQQKCQGKCAEPMAACMMPCVGDDPAEAEKPENRNKMMACVKKCSEAQAPCMKTCESKKKTP
jgi:hypothetical protein